MSKLTREEMEDWVKNQWGASKLPIGGVVPFNAASELYLTGDWREYRPVVNDDKCTGCTQCYFVCPDDVISMDDRYHPVFDYDFCKGCALCADICPVEAIDMVLEE